MKYCSKSYLEIALRVVERIEASETKLISSMSPQQILLKECEVLQEKAVASTYYSIED